MGALPSFNRRSGLLPQLSGSSGQFWPVPVRVRFALTGFLLIGIRCHGMERHQRQLSVHSCPEGRTCHF